MCLCMLQSIQIHFEKEKKTERTNFYYMQTSVLLNSTITVMLIKYLYQIRVFYTRKTKKKSKEKRNSQENCSNKKKANWMKRSIGKLLYKSLMAWISKRKTFSRQFSFIKLTMLLSNVTQGWLNNFNCRLSIYIFPNQMRKISILSFFFISSVWFKNSTKFTWFCYIWNNWIDFFYFFVNLIDVRKMYKGEYAIVICKWFFVFFFVLIKETAFVHNLNNDVMVIVLLASWASRI